MLAEVQLPPSTWISMPAMRDVLSTTPPAQTPPGRQMLEPCESGGVTSTWRVVETGSETWPTASLARAQMVVCGVSVVKCRGPA